MQYSKDSLKSCCCCHLNLLLKFSLRTMKFRKAQHCCNEADQIPDTPPLLQQRSGPHLEKYKCIHKHKGHWYRCNKYQTCCRHQPYRKLSRVPAGLHTHRSIEMLHLHPMMDSIAKWWYSESYPWSYECYCMKKESSKRTAEQKRRTPKKSGHGFFGNNGNQLLLSSVQASSNAPPTETMPRSIICKICSCTGA